MPFTPGQVSTMLKIPGSTIRLYAKLFAAYISPQTGRKQRLYTEQDILIFAKIKDLRSRHTPFDSIGPLLSVEDQLPAHPEDSALALVPSIAAELASANQQTRIALARLAELEKTTTEQLAGLASSQAAQAEQLHRQAAELAKLRVYLSLPWWRRLFTSPPTQQPIQDP
jgi:DNA-binding transcriptional MerR regulator